MSIKFHEIRRDRKSIGNGQAMNYFDHIGTFDNPIAKVV